MQPRSIQRLRPDLRVRHIRRRGMYSRCTSGCEYSAARSPRADLEVYDTVEFALFLAFMGGWLRVPGERNLIPSGCWIATWMRSHWRFRVTRWPPAAAGRKKTRSIVAGGVFGRLYLILSPGIAIAVAVWLADEGTKKTRIFSGST